MLKLNLSSKLEKNLPSARLTIIKLISTLAEENNMPIYLVGGLVRDILLEQSSQDLDFVIEGDAISLARKLTARYGGKATIHHQFGTAKWTINDVEKKHLFSQLKIKLNSPSKLPSIIDLISARSESYSYPTALPTVEKGDIKQDLQRRDFTINTMAIQLDGIHYGELYDFWEGLNDLKFGLIRVLHPLSFVDDPTRIFRAVRFEQRLNFKIEKQTLQLLKDSRPLLHEVSGDRIRHEIDLILSGNHAAEIFHRLQELDILSSIHPEFLWKDDYSQPLNKALHNPIDKKWGLPEMMGNIPVKHFIAYLILFSVIPPDQVITFAKRMHLSAVLRTALSHSNSLLIEFPHLLQSKPSMIARRLENISAVVLCTITLLAPQETWRKLIHQFLFKWKKIEPFTNGSTLIRSGISPGPVYRNILTTLRNAWVDGEVKTRDEETALLKVLLKNIP
jgi:tRNA nucleotidyltransferase (CCA-adding enzyme)